MTRLLLGYFHDMCHLCPLQKNVCFLPSELLRHQEQRKSLGSVLPTPSFPIRVGARAAGRGVVWALVESSDIRQVIVSLPFPESETGSAKRQWEQPRLHSSSAAASRAREAVLSDGSACPASPLPCSDQPVPTPPSGQHRGQHSFPHRAAPPEKASL